jgi:hypothetical protein
VSPGTARPPGRRVIRAVFFAAADVSTHALVRTKRQSFLRVRALRLTTIWRGARALLAEGTHKGQAHDGLHDPIIDQDTWDRVQALLAEHAKRAAGSRQNSQALLAGKLFDDRGNRMRKFSCEREKWEREKKAAGLQNTGAC